LVLLGWQYLFLPSTEYSDIDLSIILKNLPERRIDRRKIIKDIDLEPLKKYCVTLLNQ